MIPEEVAVMFVVPAVKALAWPWKQGKLLMVATKGFEEFQVAFVVKF